jgi:hypothetical protein
MFRPKRVNDSASPEKAGGSAAGHLRQAHEDDGIRSAQRPFRFSLHLRTRDRRVRRPNTDGSTEWTIITGRKDNNNNNIAQRRTVAETTMLIRLSNALKGKV